MIWSSTKCSSWCDYQNHIIINLVLIVSLWCDHQPLLATLSNKLHPTQSPKTSWWCRSSLCWIKEVCGIRRLQLQKLRIIAKKTLHASLQWCVKILEEVLLLLYKENYDAMKVYVYNVHPLSAPLHGSKIVQTFLKRELLLFVFSNVYSSR